MEEIVRNEKKFNIRKVSFILPEEKENGARGAKARLSSEN
jgi:hypothetical protein